MAAATTLLIVGAGQAAAVAAAALRQEGYTGKVVVVGNEPHAPYERPPLSKAILTATDSQEPVIAVRPDPFWQQADIDLRLGLAVTHLSPGEHQARLSDGCTVEFDKCLLATGGKARTVDLFPPDAPGVFYLRTLDDARALRQAMALGRRMVVVGGGFLGLEVASTAAEKGLAVSVIEAGQRVLARVTPPEFSNWLEARMKQNGVVLHAGTHCASAQPPRQPTAPWTLNLSDGTLLEADILVVSVGLAVNNQLAEQAGLAIDTANGGILVDRYCRSSHPDIFAAGDCASRAHGNTYTGLRLESWQNANEQARIAAATMLEHETHEAAYPWFWTDQFGCNIQMLGLPETGLNYVLRGSPADAGAEPKFIMLGMHKNIPRHAIAVNAGGDLRALRPLFEQAITLDPVRFTDLSVTAKAFAKSALAKT